MVILFIKTELFEIWKNTGNFAQGSPRSQGICLTSLFYLHHLCRWTELRLNNFILRSSLWHFLPLQNFLWLKYLYYISKKQQSTEIMKNKNWVINAYFFMIVLSGKYLHYECNNVETFCSSCVYTSYIRSIRRTYILARNVQKIKNFHSCWIWAQLGHRKMFKTILSYLLCNSHIFWDFLINFNGFIN